MCVQGVKEGKGGRGRAKGAKGKGARARAREGGRCARGVGHACARGKGKVKAGKGQRQGRARKGTRQVGARNTKSSLIPTCNKTKPEPQTKTTCGELGKRNQERVGWGQKGTVKGGKARCGEPRGPNVGLQWGGVGEGNVQRQNAMCVAKGKGKGNKAGRQVR